MKTKANRVELIIGGARSGKSSFAEQVAKESKKFVTYIATSQVYDDEMAKRVEKHRVQRPAGWKVVEEPIELAQALKKYSRKENCILVDCLTLWLSNCMFSQDYREWDPIKQEFLALLNSLPGQVVLVTNEIGCGVVPMGKETRRFVDEAGELHQAIAKRAARVTLVTAGLPLVLKGERYEMA
ncbi:bifunctional adenosylcobinamide kinase/adenosylcobinamide-phosphate guanylyltransferase [Vibrio sp. 10N.222.51.C12]|uniref:bifunctional adenosylcobinamide kinase/adenosylcobinamide-phosphate guanylyltransferase n=1 Tax=unclassified Vibrio TaxID=2614977 RepID=UPI000C85852A|nr:bifunctional adenosylcobinamide kinase/adenosylcobinamide-phosphate guanylyltransferase [Vibrio sp. 10N.286.48.B7]PMH77709.1 bifunctional adenosylcobinamide kinase/adenosylcobinamide-phosphate guanylyltransferase [Vibrio sp. 10N.286.48.B7]